jgi:hypothetical protein
MKHVIHYLLPTNTNKQHKIQIVTHKTNTIYKITADPPSKLSLGSNRMWFSIRYFFNSVDYFSSRNRTRVCTSRSCERNKYIDKNNNNLKTDMKQITQLYFRRSKSDTIFQATSHQKQFTHTQTQTINRKNTEKNHTIHIT